MPGYSEQQSCPSVGSVAVYSMAWMAIILHIQMAHFYAWLCSEKVGLNKKCLNQKYISKKK